MNETHPHLVLVGGFLGAGKTTLLVSAAALLKDAGLRVGLVFNDQGADLVDTMWAGSQGAVSREVTGGCFCCRFSEFFEAAQELSRMDVIFAEPVGSCTDISATILQPLKRDFPGRFRLAPLTVLVDPANVERLLSSPDTRFLFENQLAEADIVCFTKSDVSTAAPNLPGVTTRRLSAVTGQGVKAWLDEVLGGAYPAGGHVLDIDYERYAAAEAALGWLNCSFTLNLDDPLTPAVVVGPLLERLDEALTRRGAAIAHLKLVDHAESGYLKAAITANGHEPAVDGDLSASAARRHEVLLNLRAMGDPEVLREVVEQCLPAGATVRRLQAFRPSAPKPERRVATVV